MEKLKNMDGIPSALIAFALFRQINFDYYASEYYSSAEMFTGAKTREKVQGFQQCCLSLRVQ